MRAKLILLHFRRFFFREVVLLKLALIVILTIGLIQTLNFERMLNSISMETLRFIESFGIIEIFLYSLATTTAVVLLIFDLRHLNLFSLTASPHGQKPTSPVEMRPDLSLFKQQTSSNEMKEGGSPTNPQTHPDMRWEIWLKRRLPVSIKCVLVRTRIDNTLAFDNESPNEFNSRSFHHFFDSIDQIVCKYGGLVYQFIGDEVIYLFDAKNIRQAYLRALCATRDIHDAAKKMNVETDVPLNFSISLKTSLFDSDVRFEKDSKNRIYLNGEPFAKTRQALSVIDPKNSSEILINETAIEELSDLIEYQHFIQTTFFSGKNLSVLNLYSMKMIRPIETFFNLPIKAHVGDITSYRSASDIIRVMEYLLENFTKADESFTLGILKEYASFRLGQVVPEIESLLSRLLDRILANYTDEHHQNSTQTRLLATAIATVQGLIQVHRYEGEIKRALEKCQTVNNPRVAANLMETLKYFGQHIDHSFDHHRTEAVALIILSDVISDNEEWSLRCGSRLKQLVRSKDNYRLASGLFALGQINLDRKFKDELTWKNNHHLAALIKEIPNYILHANEMVRRQARIACWKAGLLNILRKTVRDPQINPLHRQELVVFLKEKYLLADESVLGQLRGFFRAAS